MRSFHTNHSCEQSMHQVPVKIGRPVPDASCSYSLSSVSNTGMLNPADSSSFSESTPRKSMIRNLIHGNEFVASQKTSLLDMERALLLINNEHALGKPVLEKAPSPILLFLKNLEEISNRSFHSCRLFGDGSEQPIKIHLRSRGKEFTHKIPILPLHGNPAFLGILYSGRSNISPSREIMDDCLTSVVQYILQADEGLSKLNELINLIQAENKIASILVETTTPQKLPHSGSRTMTKQKLFQWACRLLQTVRGTPSISALNPGNLSATG